MDNNIKNIFSELIDAFVQNAKENDTDKFQNYSDKFKSLSDFSDFKNIVINTDILDLVLLSSAKYKAALFLKNEDYIPYININITNKNDTCIINITCSQSNIKGYLQLQMPNIYVSKIKSRCADVVIRDVHIKELEIINKTGDIVAEKMLCHVLNLKTGSGDIVIKTNVKDCNYDLKSKVGDIVIKNLKFSKKSPNKMKCITDTGDIVIN